MLLNMVNRQIAGQLIGCYLAMMFGGAPGGIQTPDSALKGLRPDH